MGIIERKERQRSELRSAILVAARRILLKEGAQALTMRRIADEVEYSAGTLYLYFASRDEIAIELVREGYTKLLLALEPALSFGDPIERIRAIGRAYIAFGFADPTTYKLIFMENVKYANAALLQQPAVAHDKPGHFAFDALIASVRQAVAQGRIKPVDADAAAQAFWAGLHGVVSLYVTCPNVFGDVAVVATILEDAIVAGLCA